MAKPESTRHTVLFIGEGKTEKAFLKHLKSQYLERDSGVAVTIKDATGGGPGSIVDYAFKMRCSPMFESEFNQIVVLLDNDISIAKQVRDKAEQNDIQLIESTPCIEGLLLAILDKTVPPTAAKCKHACEKYFPQRLTKQSAYDKQLAPTRLEKRRKAIPELNALLNAFSLPPNTDRKS